jgi:hypothetical protein
VLPRKVRRFCASGGGDPCALRVVRKRVLDCSRSGDGSNRSPPIECFRQGGFSAFKPLVRWLSQARRCAAECTWQLAVSCGGREPPRASHMRFVTWGRPQHVSEHRERLGRRDGIAPWPGSGTFLLPRCGCTGQGRAARGRAARTGKLATSRSQPPVSEGRVWKWGVTFLD